MPKRRPSIPVRLVRGLWPRPRLASPVGNDCALGAIVMYVFGVFGWMRRLALMSLVVISFWFFQLPVQADGSVTLAWDPSTDTNVVSYTVYYGTGSGAYANSLSAGPATTATVTGLLAGTTYFFAATAVNSTGLESP